MGAPAYTLDQLPLSGSTDGRMIKITATATAGTLVTTTPSGTSGLSNLWLWVVNKHTSSVNVTVEWGGTTADDTYVLTIPNGQGLFPLVQGMTLRNGLAVRVFASVANVIFVTGFENRKELA
jgi:hypothetical protein